jgi:hypothetical protein
MIILKEITMSEKTANRPRRLKKWYKDIKWWIGIIIALIGTMTPLIIHFTSNPSAPKTPVEINQTFDGAAPGMTINKTININQ